jgi:hypothetical protein
VSARPLPAAQNAGRTGLKQVNVPAVTTVSTIGVASLHALSGIMQVRASGWFRWARGGHRSALHVVDLDVVDDHYSFLLLSSVVTTEPSLERGLW